MGDHLLRPLLLPDHLALVVDLAHRIEAELGGNCFRGGVIRVDVGRQPGYSLARQPVMANRPVCTAIGVNVAGERDILGLWVGDGGEGAKFWFQVFTEMKNRGTEDVCIVVCHGLKGLPEAIGNTWPLGSSRPVCCI